MKKLLFLAFSLALLACKNDPKRDYAIISGKIINKEVGELSINSFDRTFTEPITISEDGSFQDTLSTDRNLYVLFDGKNPIFMHIEPGYNLTINYDTKDFDNSLSITGIGSEVANYLAAKRKNEKTLFGNANETYSLNETEFKEKLQEIKKSQTELLKSSKDIPSNFRTKEERNLLYAYLNKLTDYESAHKYFTRDQDFNVSDDFLMELNDVDYGNESDYLFSNDYKDLVTNHQQEEAIKLAKNDSIPNDIAFLKTVSTISNETIKNGLLFDFSNHGMVQTKDIETFYRLFITNSTDDKNNTLITEKYNKLTALSKGKPSPVFTNYKNFAGGKTSLNDLKGKYIYIDVWATWCGPCIREIPALKKTEEQYRGKNIEFVSISVDKLADYEKWRTMVADKELSGVQLFADDNENSTFVQDYQINSIPRFILIDPNGNIVDANAPRPTGSELITLFTEIGI